MGWMLHRLFKVTTFIRDKVLLHTIGRELTMKQKTVLAPYGVYVNVYVVINGDQVLWFSEEAVEAAEKCAHTHSEIAEPEPSSDYVFKERY